MGTIEWAMWANEQAVLSAWILLIGGIVGCSYKFNYWQCAVVNIFIALFVLWLEWPRSKRVKGNTIERQFQSYMVPIHDKLGPFVKNYYVRFGLYLVLSVPGCFLLPTIMGSMCLQIGAIIYLVAAIRKEEWRPTKVKSANTDTRTPKIVGAQPPSHPPPRAPVKRNVGQVNESADLGSVELEVQA